VLFVLLLAGLALALLPFASSAQSYMRAHFIDVGQADAILLEFRCGSVLIDAGAHSGWADTTDQLIDYLSKRLTDSFGPKNVLDYVIITHDDTDHTESLPKVFSGLAGLTVRNFVHSGLTEPKGEAALEAAQYHVNPDHSHVTIHPPVTSERIMKADGPDLLTDDDMDPVGDDCATCDPRISILSGRFTVRPKGLTDGEWTALRDQDNNRSVVVRVDLGKFSMLLTGDLQEPGIKALTNYYVSEHPQSPEGSGGDKTLLDADLYKVGHHGSHNATTWPFAEAISPQVAVISVGRHDQHPTKGYGHPSWAAIGPLLSAITGRRDARYRMIGHYENGETVFRPVLINRKIYATAWDGTVKVIGRKNGTFAVYRNQH
jgi:competence protein ComEC